MNPNEAPKLKEKWEIVSSLSKALRRAWREETLFRNEEDHCPSSFGGCDLLPGYYLVVHLLAEEMQFGRLVKKDALISPALVYDLLVEAEGFCETIFFLE